MPAIISCPTDPDVKFIELFPGYAVGNNGAVWSRWARGGSGANRRRLGTKWIIMWPTVDSDGYLRIRLTIRGKRLRFFVHTLVLTAFVGPRPPGMQCRHLDGNRANPELRNLVWGTPLENAADRSRHGRQPYGEASNLARLTEQQVLEIRRLRALGVKLEVIGSQFGVTKDCVSRIALGKNWRHLLTPTNPPVTTVTHGNGCAKLTERQVFKIRRLRASGVKCASIAVQFGVTESTVSGIATGKTWQHLLSPGNPGVTHGNGNSKLNEQQVLKIRELQESGTSTAEIAARFGVSKTTIRRIASGSVWRHLHA